MRRRALLAAAAAVLVPAAPAAAHEPRLTVPAKAMRAALTCHPGKGQPLIYAPGTGSDGSGVYALGKGAFDRLGRPVCTVAFPDRTTADVQDSVQYLVHAIRSEARRTHGPVAVAGISQGGLLARMALTYWPSLRRKVTDVVSLAAPQHGTQGSPQAAATCLTQGCPPALWQQRRGSALLDALDDGRDETPGRTAWTTVRTATDEVVQPPSTAKLRGAVNVRIQDVCPGRSTTHIGTAVDSVSIAVLVDAVTHRGPARAARLPRDVCAHPYGTGLDEQQTAAYLGLATLLLQGASGTVPVVQREPRVRAWVSRG